MVTVPPLLLRLVAEPLAKVTLPAQYPELSRKSEIPIDKRVGIRRTKDIDWIADLLVPARTEFAVNSIKVPQGPPCMIQLPDSCAWRSGTIRVTGPDPLTDETKACS